jgi:acetylglutamate kinase
MILIKLGGNALGAASDSSQIDFLAEYHKGGEQLLLVHGGGPQIDQEMRLHGIEKKTISGFRVTSEEAYDVVEMVLTGSVQQKLVREFKARGVMAVGLSGSDGGIFAVGKKFLSPTEDLGQVGEVLGVDTTLLQILLRANYLPVISSTGALLDGTGMNINADLAAAAIAGALDVKKVIFMSDIRGIYSNFPNESSIISKISRDALYEMRESFTGGMLPKVEAALKALDSGASSVQIIDGRDSHDLKRALQGEQVGTLISHG